VFLAVGGVFIAYIAMLFIAIVRGFNS
jgi:hypothetical protein